MPLLLALLVAFAVALLLAAPALAAGRTVDVPRGASLVLAGERDGDLAGASVAAAGDVNGDGRADVIVGAPRADPRDRANAGSAYVVFGGGPRGRVSLGRLGARGFRIDGAVPAPGGRGGDSIGAGAVVAGAGDVNGDGLGDVLVSGRFGSPYSSTAAFVVFGKRDTAPVDLAALGAGGYLIRSSYDVIDVIAAHPAGDINGDGRADTAVTTLLWGGEDTARMFVVFGKADAAPVDVGAEAPALPAAPWGFAVDVEGAGLTGLAVAPAGDVNRDGLGDLLLGAPGASPHDDDADGAVFVLYGTRAPASAIVGRRGQRFGGFEVDGPRAGGGFGFAVARLGRGFVAGAPGNPYRGLHGRGGAWIVPSRRARPIRLAGPRTGGPAGMAVDTPGDVDGDRRSDVLVVARGHRGGAAEAFLFSRRGHRIATYRGLRNSSEPVAHTAAAGAGDAGGDRRADLIFGSPGANAAYVLTSG